MKLVLDMNMPFAWTEFLRAAGHIAVHWRSIGDIRAEDHEIMCWARDNGYVVLMIDPRRHRIRLLPLRR